MSPGRIPDSTTLLGMWMALRDGGAPTDEQFADLDPMIRALLEGQSDALAIELSRARVQAGRTFSEEAITEVVQTLQMFLMARLFRHWRDTGVPPTKAVLTFAVTYPSDA